MSLFSDRLFSLFVAASFALTLGWASFLTHERGGSAVYQSGAYRLWLNEVTFDTSRRDLMSGPVRPATLASSTSHAR